VGGGTPTVDSDELIATLDLLRQLSPIRSISIETNPNHLVPQVLERYRDAGVTRLSVGVQSFDDQLLEKMERRNKYGSGAQVRASIAGAKGIFQTLNIDMIFNLPGQTFETLDRDLDVVRELAVDQVSFYPLMTAPTARHKMERTMGHSDSRLRHAMYERILDRMLDDYRPSSAWCFSRSQGMYDEYIIDQDDYVGIGSGAVSYVGGAMYSTTFSLNHYCRLVEDGRSGITKRQVLGPKERMRYDYLVRLFGGELKRDYVARRHGRAFWWRMAPELIFMRLVGATRHDPDAIRLTRRGMYCWVLMMAEFFNSVNVVREQMRSHIRAELDAWNNEEAAPLPYTERHAGETNS
jgi:coproporphyrinogen III oxidase-like Fe-S oxidoreductase